MTEPLKNTAVIYRVSDGSIAKSRKVPMGDNVADTCTLKAGEAFLFGQFVDRPDYFKVEEGVVVPSIGPTAVPLEEVKFAAHQQIDTGAGYIRASIASKGYGQEMTYLRKEAQARAYLAELAAGNAPTPENYPLPFAEIGITGATMQLVCEAITAKADEWDMFAGAIEAARLSTKKAVADAASAEDVTLIMNNLTWPTPE